jgi:hypothetical protein
MHHRLLRLMTHDSPSPVLAGGLSFASILGEAPAQEALIPAPHLCPRPSFILPVKSISAPEEDKLPARHEPMVNDKTRSAQTA